MNTAHSTGYFPFKTLEARSASKHQQLRVPTVLETPVDRIRQVRNEASTDVVNTVGNKAVSAQLAIPALRATTNHQQLRVPTVPETPFDRIRQVPNKASTDLVNKVGNRAVSAPFTNPAFRSRTHKNQLRVPTVPETPCDRIRHAANEASTHTVNIVVNISGSAQLKFPQSQSEETSGTSKSRSQSSAENAFILLKKQKVTKTTSISKGIDR